MNLLKAVFRFVVLAIKALMHPENEKEWRMAWMWFVWPVFFIGGFGLLVAAVLHLLHLPWWMITGWLFYLWVIEPLAYLLTPGGEALQRKQAHWIEYGGE